MSGGIGDVEIGEPPCTCSKHPRRGEKGSPWVEIEYDPDCVYHFAANGN